MYKVNRLYYIWLQKIEKTNKIGVFYEGRNARNVKTSAKNAS